MQVAPVKPETLLLVGLVGLAAFMLAKAAKAAPEALATVGRALNPTSDQNLAYRGAGAVVSSIVGREETLGGWIYDLTHGTPTEQAERRLSDARWDAINNPPLDINDPTTWVLVL